MGAIGVSDTILQNNVPLIHIDMAFINFYDLLGHSTNSSSEELLKTIVRLSYPLQGKEVATDVFLQAIEQALSDAKVVFSDVKKRKVYDQNLAIIEALLKRLEYEKDTNIDRNPLDPTPEEQAHLLGLWRCYQQKLCVAYEAFRQLVDAQR